MGQIHKRFTDEQVKVLFQGYCQSKIDRIPMLSPSPTKEEHPPDLRQMWKPKSRMPCCGRKRLWKTPICQSLDTIIPLYGIAL